MWPITRIGKHGATALEAAGSATRVSRRPGPVAESVRDPGLEPARVALGLRPSERSTARAPGGAYFFFKAFDTRVAILRLWFAAVLAWSTRRFAALSRLW